jgi:hypothetical protein
MILQKAVEDQNAMLYKMLEKVNEDREKKIKEKNMALMKKIRRLECKKHAMDRGEEPGMYSDEEDEIEDMMEQQEERYGGYAGGGMQNHSQYAPMQNYNTRIQIPNQNSPQMRAKKRAMDN